MLRVATIIFSLLVAGAGTSSANTPSPEPAGVAPDIFVLSVYHTKLEAEAVSDEMGRAMTDSLILDHFSADLLNLYKSTYYADEPIIDGDVFMMAQDWDTKEVATVTKSQDANTATVEATFTIAGEPRKVTFMLKALKRGGWEIDDIASENGNLREWIREGLAAAQPGATP